MLITENNYREYQGYPDSLELATIGDRIKAFIVDDLLITFIFMIMVWDNLMAASEDINMLLALLSAYTIEIMVIKVLYQTYFTYSHGATLGKMFAGTIVIDDENLSAISLKTAFLRSFGRILSEPFYWGFAMGFFTKGRQTFHDKLGKTVVVYVG
jgi:uncharacterized RDD family membrane protein YckC